MHTHGIPTGRQFGSRSMPVGDGGNVYTIYSSSAGGHNHTVTIGAHSHSFSKTTGNTGSGSSVLIVNTYIMLMGWYRIS